NIEDMLSQLISMVGSIRTEMKQEFSDVKQEQSDIKQDISSEELELTEMLAESRKTNDKRHREIINEFKISRADQDHIRKKSVQNEREIAHLKSQYSN